MNKIGILVGLASLSAVSFGQVASFSGQIDFLASAPANVALGNLESEKTSVFVESTGVTLASALAVDANGAGTFNSNGSLNGGSIAAGTVVDSTLIHHDKIGGSSTIVSAAGSVTFYTRILGVFVKDATLQGSDSLLGAGSTTYGSGNRKMEMGTGSIDDNFVISGDMKTITFLQQTNTAIDEIRVVTEAVPEPGTMALIGFGVAAMAVRRKRK